MTEDAINVVSIFREDDQRIGLWSDVAEIAVGQPARYNPPMRRKSTLNHAKGETAQLSQIGRAHV